MSEWKDYSIVKAEPSKGTDEKDSDIPTAEAFFRVLSKRMGGDWEPIATSLGILNQQITGIKEQHDDPEEQIFQMLLTWQQDLPPDANAPSHEEFKKTLAKALAENRRKDLASEIEAGKLNPPQESLQKVPTSASGNVVGHPDEVDEKKLRKLAEYLPGDWEKLATELGIPSGDVEKIKKKYKDSKVTEKIFQMLLKWKQMNNPGVDYKGTLIDALKNIGRRDVAEKLKSDTL